NQTLGTAHARHLGEHTLRIFTMVQREARNDEIERVLSERKMFSISNLKAQICESSCLTHLLCNRERCFSQIETYDFAACLRKGHGDVTGTGCHIEHTSLRMRMHELHEAIEAILILDQRIRCVRLCLMCEF